ncbi:MAG: hypothetical protein ACI8PZ_003810 [Myxococcota bacterium]|jgi:hypothetical protein
MMFYRHAALRLFTGLALAFLVWSPGAMAQSTDDFDPDDDEFEFDDLDDPDNADTVEGEEEEEEAEPSEGAEGTDDGRLEEDDDLDFIGDPDDEEIQSFEDALGDDEDDDEFDLLDGEEDASVALPGQDTAAAYRAAQTQFERLPADEELQSWEAYMAQYPNTLFRTAIEQRMDGLMKELYGTRIERGGGEIDALNAEVPISTGMMLENINPRTRIQAGFEWGLPDYINLMADYEHALGRTFSFHAGVRRRYSGWSIEPGVHWALVKSTRTQTLVTLIGDFHLNANPAYAGIRPQLAIGKRFGDKLDLQAQFGPDFEFRTPLDLRLVGGANATFRASEVVGIFVEGSLHMKNFNWDNGPFAFNVVTFGMKFFPGKVGDDEGGSNVEANFGGTVPFQYNYWQYHFGSLMGQANVFLD